MSKSERAAATDKVEARAPGTLGAGVGEGETEERSGRQLTAAAGGGRAETSAGDDDDDGHHHHDKDKDDGVDSSRRSANGNASSTLDNVRASARNASASGRTSMRRSNRGGGGDGKTGASNDDEVDDDDDDCQTGSAKERNAIDGWRALLLQSTDELRSLIARRPRRLKRWVARGVPDVLRGQVWQLLSGGRELRIHNPGVYYKLLVYESLPYMKLFSLLEHPPPVRFQTKSCLVAG